MGGAMKKAAVALTGGLAWVLSLSGSVVSGKPPSMPVPPRYEVQMLGLADADHTSEEGLLSAGVREKTLTGYVLGESDRYDLGGQSVWLYDGRTSETVRLGLLGDDYTNVVTGWQYSRASGVSDSGYAIGSSDRYEGGFDSGYSAWLYDPALGTTTRIGLFDPFSHQDSAALCTSTPGARRSE
jgi:hypothetical protein